MTWKKLVLGLAVAVIALAVWTGLRASAREEAINTAYPPQGQMLTVDGRQIHAVVSGSGPDLVMLHGAGGNVRDMAPLAELLADRFRVIRFDRPGMGHTEADPQHRGAWSQGAATPQEQAALLARAAEQLGAKAPLVLGHSFGGAVAMAWGLDQPSSGLIIVSGATLPWPDEYAIGTRNKLLSGRIGGAVLAPLATAFVPESTVQDAVKSVFYPDPAPEAYAQDTGSFLSIRRSTLRANARQVAALYAALSEMAPRYPTLSLPVEILHGTADESVGYAIHAAKLQELLPNSTLTDLPGIGHMPHHTAKSAVAAAVARAAARAGLR